MGPLCAQKLFRSPAHKRHMGKLEKNARYFDKECCIYMPPLSEFYLTFQQLIRVTVAAVQSASQIRLFANSWAIARQAPLSSTISQSLLRFMSTELVMLSNHLILYHPFLLLLSIFSNIRFLSNESALHIRWPKY